MRFERRTQRRFRLASGDVRTLRFDVDGVQRLAAGHEQAVALGAAEADVAADLRQQDLADARAVRGEDVDAVVAVADPAGAGPDVAVDVGADAVGEAGLLAAFSSSIEANSRPLASFVPSTTSQTLMFFGASG